MYRTVAKEPRSGGRAAGHAAIPVPVTLDGVSRTFAFVQIDVFTDRVFGGNQLAVFFDLEPAALSDAEMQAIALEMNLAETTFVYPPTQSAPAPPLPTSTPR